MMVGPTRRNLNGGLGDVDVGDQYNSFAPLPRYTPRPIDANDEKPPAFEHLQSMTNRRSSEYPMDEKTPLDIKVDQARTNLAGDHSSDASSTFSVPSSFGNTSTATTETPPPPYSVRSSRAPSQRSMSISISPSLAELVQGSSMPSPVTQPQPAFFRNYEGQTPRRPSIEQRNVPPFPPAYSRP
ncbi:hypothetical protein PRK78_005179 [Emydomyces testavorans]|uniref:Uncharacterized protein n=1 Tax=Emydomyces testavorans TaxID=2070801 RepID=A0AAF0IMD6_9EURO|nr:hypothetical protein PRK78_005179 [Emydomyces testavorans]